MNYAIAFSIVFYAGVQFFEVNALLARVAGIRSASTMVGYSIQNAVYMVTRFLLMLLLPVLGYLVDKGISPALFKQLVHLSLLFSTGACLLAFIFSDRTVGYFNKVVSTYRGKSGFVSALLNPSNVHDMPKTNGRIAGCLRIDLRTFLLSNFVYTVYSVGIFVVFYMALVFHDSRAMISQMSGAINAFGAVVITFIVEPQISRSIDKREAEAEVLVASLFWGRVFAIGISGQIAMGLMFHVV